VAEGIRPTRENSTRLLTVVIVGAVLYFAREVFIPLALAFLLAFLLAPLVTRLRHWGLGRVLSAIIVVFTAFCLIAIICLVMASQLTDLARKLPGYQQNIQEKVHSIQVSGGGFLERATRVIHDFTTELTPKNPAPARTQSGEEKPVPVEIRKAPFSPVQIIRTILGSLLNIVITALIVIVFVIFMLVQKEDLRDRLIRLFGAGRVNITTQALDDAGGRLSRYLLTQVTINATFGILAGSVLYFIHVPNPVLWGLAAALLRYVPYLGIWVAATMPAMMAFAVEPGWVKVPIIFGSYAGIDLLLWNFAEPMLYGNSTGISPLAILLAAVFWTWLWGPVGLFLATPLTVGVAVIGRYVPSMEFLSILLGDEPALKPETKFYQRMLAMNLDEATELAENYLKGKSLEQLNDAVIIPALKLAEEDRHRGKLDEERQHFMFQNTRLLVEDVAERAETLIAGSNSSRKSSTDEQINQNAKVDAHPEVLCIPARDEADEIAALMLEQLLSKRGIRTTVLSCAGLMGECIHEVEKRKPRVVCIAAVPPFGYVHARYLCRRLRSRFPQLKVVAAILTEGDVSEIKKRQPPVPADEIGASLTQALAAILSLLPTAESRPQHATRL
jgi:predicted PurR-regulated permease PerM